MSAGGKKLGVLIPALRHGQPYIARDIEAHRYNDWIARFGIAGVGVREGLTLTPGSHLIDCALETGSLDVLLPAASKLAAAGCDAIAWACTCASFVGGLAWAERQVDELARVSGLPATSTSLSMLAATQALGAETVDVLSPYPARLTHTFLGLLNDAGIDVAAMTVLDCPEPEDSHALDLRREVNLFDGGLSPRTHPLLIPDTAIDAIALIPVLEADLGRPVVSGNHATLWHSLKLLDIDCAFAEGGALLAGQGCPETDRAAAD
jgi:maleate isomerase